MSGIFSKEEVERLTDIQEKRSAAEEFFKDDTTTVSEQIYQLFEQLPPADANYTYVVPLAQLIHIEGEELGVFSVRAMHLSSMYETWSGIVSLIPSEDSNNVRTLPTKLIMATMESLATSEDYGIVLSLAYEIANEKPVADTE